jgi:hypothetical protein
MFGKGVVTLTVAFVALTMFGVASASANFETVKVFAGSTAAPEEPTPGHPVWPEEMQLGGVAGMAVNRTGAGGVAPGTLYTVGDSGGIGWHAARYSPEGKFELAWTGGSRCGPKTEEPGHETCPSLESGNTSGDIDIDQTSGNVYIFNRSSVEAGKPTVREYSPDASKLIATFALEAPPSSTVAETPDEVHSPSGVGGIAVDDNGTVYLFDETNPEFLRRLMIFEPESPGDYEHYVYSGEILVRPLAQNPPTRPVLDDSGHIFVGGEDFIEEYDLSQPSNPVCKFTVNAGGVRSMTINPATGEPFYYSDKNEKIHQLACNGEGKFVEKAAFKAEPQHYEISAMVFNPERQYDPNRKAGVLYAGAPQGLGGVKPVQSSLGYILAHPLELSPQVESESASQLGNTTATLGAQIDPRGSQTSYLFQYLDDAAYEANEPDERQALTVSATGGVFGLGFEGERLGGLATATLTAGSNAATSLHTATGTATLKAASGTATLNGITGKGTLISGSTKITSAKADKGSFQVGNGISGEGIPSGTTIFSVTPEEAPGNFEIAISKPATASAAHASLSVGTATLTEVVAEEGSFEVGEQISGAGIPDKATIEAIGPGELVLSKPVSGPAEKVKLKAGSPVLTGVTQGIGSFHAGQPIEGKGIDPGTTITAVEANTLTLSKIPLEPGTGVAISSPEVGTLAVGERIEGVGIPPNTTIVSIEAGKATLSNAATASGKEVLLKAGLPFDARPTQVQAALEGLSTIGAGGVKVSGGPGDEAGSSPYGITLGGALEDVDVEQLIADGSNLSGGPATATVQTEHNGGGGFATGVTEVPVGGAPLGSGQESLSASVALTGLAPGAAYHYRAVATSHCSEEEPEKVCEDTGPSQGFRTFGVEAPVLPDNRAYELVSPVQKNGGEVLPAEPKLASCGAECKPGLAAERFATHVAPGGEGIAYQGSPFSFNEGASEFDEYISKRTASGWQTTSLSPPLAGDGGSGGFRAFALSSDLTKSIVYAKNPALTPEAPVGYRNLYAQQTNNRFDLEPLLRQEPPNRTPEGPQAFQIEYAGGTVDLSRAFFSANAALTEETPSAPEAVDGGVNEFNLYEWSDGHLSLVNVQPGNTETISGAVFGSGEALGIGQGAPADFSNAISPAGSRVFWSSEGGQVYVRENGETTREIPDHAGKFVSASKDGSKVLLSDGILYDLETEESTDLTGGKGGFKGLSGQSDDLSHIYFVDNEVLDETPNGVGAEAQAGKPNLYAWHEGTVSFVTTLQPDDNTSDLGVWSASPVRRGAEASPDGRWFVFNSKAEATGKPSIGACLYEPNTLEYIGSVPCEEVFLYDSQTGKLTCASCNPVGEHPHGGSFLRLALHAKGYQSQPRYLTDQGRLFFDSRDSLAANDTNGKVEDVYEFEPEGVGSCTKEGGCVSLISAGHEPTDSNFFAMDEGGKNVFFTTRDQLVLKDKDDVIDLYDAREGGGFPSETEVARSECQGEACQPQVSAPNDPTPASSSFEGAGNVDEKKAAKKHKKAHKKKHAKKKSKGAHKRTAKNNRGGAK